MAKRIAVYMATGSCLMGFLVTFMYLWLLRWFIPSDDHFLQLVWIIIIQANLIGGMICSYAVMWWVLPEEFIPIPHRYLQIGAGIIIPIAYILVDVFIFLSDHTPRSLLIHDCVSGAAAFWVLFMAVQFKKILRLYYI
jgi:hypothetical protein